MRIAHIAPPWISIPPKSYGGTENVIYYLVEEEVAQGHDVTLLAPGDAKTSAQLVSFFPESLIPSGVPWQGHLKAYYHIQKAVDYVKDHDFDIVHLHLSSSADMYVFPLVAQLATPHLVTLHSRFPFDRVQQWTGDADKYFMEWLKDIPIVAISECARDEVAYPLNFVGIVHHGLPLSQFQPTVSQPEEFFAWLGRFVPEKGAHLAIEAAKRAGVPLVLAGIVDPNIELSVRYFEEQIKPHVDGEQIRYIGPVNLEQKMDLLSHARGLLNPIAWEEPFGMVMLEAMAVGCPVIAFARGAAPEIVMHRKGGFLVHDVREMVQFIAKVDQLDRNAVREHALQHFSAPSMVQKYVKIYRKIATDARKLHLVKPAATITTFRPSLAPQHLQPSANTDEMPSLVRFPSTLVAQNKVELEPPL